LAGEPDLLRQKQNSGLCTFDFVGRMADHLEYRLVMMNFLETAGSSLSTKRGPSLAPTFLFDRSNHVSAGASPVSLLSSEIRREGDGFQDDFLISSSRAACALREQALDAGLRLSWRKLTERWAGGLLACDCAAGGSCSIFVMRYSDSSDTYFRSRITWNGPL
jgi:hypothetical protein